MTTAYNWQLGRDMDYRFEGGGARRQFAAGMSFNSVTKRCACSTASLTASANLSSAAPERGGRRDHDAPGRASLALGVGRDQHPVVQHPDGGLLGHRVSLRITSMTATRPATAPAVLRMLSVRGCPAAST